MLNKSVLRVLENPILLRKATEQDLREVCRGLDEMAEGPRKDELVKAFKAECAFRSGRENDSLYGGEWI